MGNHNMIGQILGSLGGLAKSYIDAKTTVKITEAEIKKKELTGKIDWEQSANEVSKDSWKDEAWTLCFIVLIIVSFIPSLQPYVAQGIQFLSTFPEWLQWSILASIGASFGLKSIGKFTK